MARDTCTKSRESWLDGLRGIAAAIVTWFHFTAGEIPTPYRSFWDEPASENRRLIQLPPLRLLFAGDAMVSLFFVISGYSVSIAIIRLRSEENNAHFYRKLTSSVLRRGIRLYFPVLIICIISHSLFYAGSYNAWVFGSTEGCPGADPRSAIWPHLKCLILTIYTSLNLAGSYSTLGLQSHIWTIPHEFRGSMSIYLAILGLVSVRPNVRLAILLVLDIQLLWFGMPVPFAFIAGLIFAELDDGFQRVPYQLPAVMNMRKTNIKQACCSGLAARIALFISGIYLLCLPFQDHLTADYWFRFQIDLPFWANIPNQIRCWHTVGAVIVVGTLRNLPSMRAPLEWELAQYLAKISFSMYLLHPTIIRIFRNPILQFVCQSLGGKDYWWTTQDPTAAHVVVLAWLVASAIVGPMVVLISNYMSSLIDQKPISFAYHLERLISVN